MLDQSITNQEQPWFLFSTLAMLTECVIALPNPTFPISLNGNDFISFFFVTISHLLEY